MDRIDATDRTTPILTATPPSLLTVILDTSPASWAHLNETLPLSSVLKALFIFLNAHIALNHANHVAVLASHVKKVQWIYPSPSRSLRNGQAGAPASKSEPLVSPPNKFRPFAILEHHIRANLTALLQEDVAEPDLDRPPLLSTAISLALTYANVQNLLSSPLGADSDPSSTLSHGEIDAYTSAIRTGSNAPQLVSRILVISVSPADSSVQYISLMNAVFAAQRLNIPIDMIRLGPKIANTAFLQQASDVTRGIFMTYDPNDTNDSLPATSSDPMDLDASTNPLDPTESDNSDVHVLGLLQTFMMAYLPDPSARQYLVSLGSAEVDFRAACFCHGNIVSSGGICSVCLSIFCLPLAPDTKHCPTCNSRLKFPKSLLRSIVTS